MSDAITRKQRLLDLGAVAPLILFYAFAVAGLGIQSVRRIDGEAMSPHLALWLLSQAAFAAFFALQVVLFLIRRLPVAKAPGWQPRLIAILGGYASMLFIPRVTLTGGWLALSTVLSVAGIAGAGATLMWLGRSFSIFPQARGLVITGPYRLVRHPMYLSEFVASAGIMLQFEQPWSALMVAAIVAIQVKRMRYEEEILSQTFPEYPAYAARTPMLIPFLRPAVAAKASN